MLLIGILLLGILIVIISIIGVSYVGGFFYILFVVGFIIIIIVPFIDIPSRGYINPDLDDYGTNGIIWE